MTTSSEAIVRNALKEQYNLIEKEINSELEYLSWLRVYNNDKESESLNKATRTTRNRIKLLRERKAKVVNAIVNVKVMISQGLF
jgi:hypothetical protein